MYTLQINPNLNLCLIYLSFQGLKSKMDESNHQIFLHKTLWYFAQTSCLTDITFQCQDMALSAHRAILSATVKNLFSTFPGLANSTAEQVTVFLPDWTGDQVEQALNSLYALRDPSQLEQILGLDRGDIGGDLGDQSWGNSSSFQNIGCLDDFLPDQDNDIFGNEVKLEKLENQSIAKCSWCGKQFKSKASLEVHEMKVHLGEDLQKGL